MKKALAVFTVQEFREHIARQVKWQQAVCTPGTPEHAEGNARLAELILGAKPSHPSLVRTPSDKGFYPPKKARKQ